MANAEQKDADGDGIGDACEELSSSGGAQKSSDCNQDGNLDLSDGVCLLGHLFAGRPARLPCGDGTIADPANVQLLDSNADRALDLSDAVGIFIFLFSGGRAPASCLDPQCFQCSRIPGCETRCGP